MPFLVLQFQLVLNALLGTIQKIDNLLSGHYFSEDGSSYWHHLWSSIVRMPEMIGPSPDPIDMTFSSRVSRGHFSTPLNY